MSDMHADVEAGGLRLGWNQSTSGPSWLSQNAQASVPSMFIAAYAGALAMVLGRRLYFYIDPHVLDHERFTSAFSFTGDLAMGLSLTFVLLTWLRMRHMLQWVAGYAGLTFVLFGERWIAVYMPQLYAAVFDGTYVTIAMNVPSRGHELLSQFF